MMGLKDFSESFITGNSPSLHGGLETALLVLLLSFALGHVIAWVYVWTHTGLSSAQSFTASLVIMPVRAPSCSSTALVAMVVP